MIELAAIAVACALALFAVARVRAAPARPARHGDLASRPAQVERVERALWLSSTAQDAHLRLRPLLQEVASARLWVRGVDLDAPAALELLGEPLWEFVRPDRPPPAGFTRGPTAADVDAMLDRLESL